MHRERQSLTPMHKDWHDLAYTIQVAPEEAAKICVDVCPARSKTAPENKALTMVAQPPLLEPERAICRVPSMRTTSTRILTDGNAVGS
jgi:hypothetical protein